ncbi:MAG TPA: FlgD immunoglobulin-like domain containing protein, partial [bacterium]|nr:FlgD immunoglobulin-like domain containing protein [bacterium]
QEVKTLVNENLQAGYQTVLWDGRNAAGQAVSSGVYLYRLQAEALDTKQRYTKTRKMLLVK